METNMETNQLSWKQISCISKENYDGGHNRNKKRCWLIRIRQDQQHGNKPTLMVTKHKQKETLADYGNRSAKN
jgi:hypothetical protein